MRVNQWVPAAHKGDAIGDSARRVRGLLRAMGHESEVFALSIDDDLRHDIRPFSDPASKRGDVTIFHFALPSPMSAAFAALPHGRVLQYHNVTPARFFAPYAPALFRLASIARDELASLAPVTDLALGDSAYNRQELDELGFSRTGVMPIAVDTERLTNAPRSPCWRRFSTTGSSIFCSSDGSRPNKKIEDHIRLAEQYKRYVDAYYRFIFVGRYDVVPQYYAIDPGAAVRVQDAGGSVHLHGPGARRRARRVLSGVERLHLAERARRVLRPSGGSHGDGRPGAGVQRGGRSRHAGGAGVQFAPKDLEYAAELLGMLAFEESPREEVLAGQRRRLQDFGDPVIQQRWLR